MSTFINSIYVILSIIALIYTYTLFYNTAKEGKRNAFDCIVTSILLAIISGIFHVICVALDSATPAYIKPITYFSIYFLVIAIIAYVRYLREIFSNMDEGKVSLKIRKRKD